MKNEQRTVKSWPFWVKNTIMHVTDCYKLTQNVRAPSLNQNTLFSQMVILFKPFFDNPFLTKNLRKPIKFF